MFHTLQYLISVKDKINALRPPNTEIGVDDLKPVRPQDTAVSLSKLIGEKYQEVVN